MAIIERDVVLQGKSGGNPTIDLPVTRLGLIEAGAESKTALVDADALPVVDSEDAGEMKKITWADAVGALKGKLDSVYATYEQGAAADSHARDSGIHVTPEQMENIGLAVGDLVAHLGDMDDIHVTAAKQARWDEGAQRAARAIADILALQNVDTGLEGRIARLEDGLFSNITGNPWAAGFGSLEGIALGKGCWNVAQQRIEC